MDAHRLSLTAIVALIAAIIAVVAIAESRGQSASVAPVSHDHAPPAAAAVAPAPTLADAKGVAFEPFTKVDPTLHRSRTEP